MEAPSVELSCERPAPGVVVYQPRRGYRYGVEVYLLADFALRSLPMPASVIELGSGSGVVSLLLARLGVSVVGVDREPRWVALARRSAEESGLSCRFELQDIRDPLPYSADLVITNPPWFPADQPVSPDPWRASARSMLHGNVGDFVRAGLGCADRVCVVTRPERTNELRVPGSFLARVAVHGPLLLAEVRRGESPGEPVVEGVDVAAAYRWAGMPPPR